MHSVPLLVHQPRPTKGDELLREGRHAVAELALDVVHRPLERLRIEALSF